MWRWWDRFLKEGVDGLLDDVRRGGGRKPLSEDKVRELIDLAMSPPPKHARYWTLRALAKELGIAVSTVFGVLKCNGTTCLMAALDIATGKVTGQRVERHRSEEFLAFLDHVAAEIEPGTPVHVILDNVSSHKSTEVNRWLKDRPDCTFHFTPTSASWMNAVEGFFSKLWRQKRKHAIFNARDECIAAIEDDIDHHKANDARPFRWSRKPEDLVEAWKRGHHKLHEMAANE